MNYRIASILAEKSLGTAQTETIDLNIQDPISRIDIQYKPFLASSAMLAALPVNITKIELVDGSEVLHSLEGRQNQALCLYDRRAPTLNSSVTSGGVEAAAIMGIDFGRFLYDPQLAFVPTKFRNPQLKITHDRALVDAACTTHTLEVNAHVFDEKVITPIGFLVAKGHVSYVAASEGAKEDLDLPLDAALRQIIVRGWHTGVSPLTVFTHFRLSEDNDKRIPYDVEADDYCLCMKGIWAAIEETMADYTNDNGDYYKYVTPTDHWVSVAAIPNGVDNPIKTEGGSQGGYVHWECLNTAWSTAIVRGYLPHHCIQFPFGNQQDLDDWYDVTRLGSLKARITSGSNYGAGSEIQLITQQLRRY